MRENNKPIVIFSVYQKNKTQSENSENHEKVLEFLKRNDLAFDVGIGVYRSEPEKSILVVFNELTELELVKRIADSFNQESILVSNEVRKSHLFYLKTREKQEIGILKRVENVSNLDAYTVMNGLFYTCVKE